MSFRAVLIGLVGAILIAGGGYLHDHINDSQISALGLDPQVSITSGHLLPVIVLGSLIIFMVVVNPQLRRIGWQFGPGELAVIVTLLTVGCSIPSRGLMQSFAASLTKPIQYNHDLPGWRSTDVLSYVPPQMLANQGHYGDKAIGGIVGGLSEPGKRIGLADVPWYAWEGPLKTYLPLIILLAVCSVCLGLIVHKQWVHHERLRYPIAEFTSTLTNQDDHDHLLGPIFRNRLFWIGLAVVLTIRLINGTARWFPEALFEIPMKWRFDQVTDKWLLLSKVTWGKRLFLPIEIYPAVIAFTFFLAWDVGLSLALAHIILTPIALILISYGIIVKSSYMAGGGEAWQRWGSYVAYMLVLVYLGRRYYWQVLKKALAFRRQDDVENYAAWALRILIVAAGVLTYLLVRMGLDWTLAIGTVLMMLITFVGVSRISAETGLFFIHPRWQTMGIFLGVMGAFAFGPEGIVIVGMLCVILTLDPSQSLMPFLVNGLKLCSLSNVKIGRVGFTAGTTFTIAVLLTIVVVLWANYDMGLIRTKWTSQDVPKMVFNRAVKDITQLKLSGELEQSQALTPIQRITNIKPEPMVMWFVGAGFVLVLAFSWARLRFFWWPLHPVIFLVWATYPIAYFTHSFMIGWLIKRAVMNLGGHRGYIKARPLMFGVIAGELLGALIFMAIGVIYHQITGKPPKAYPIFPH